MEIFRPIASRDDGQIAALIRRSLSQRGLDLPGTAYFDPHLDRFSDHYAHATEGAYFVLVDERDQVLGGVGFDRYSGFPACAELQKLYLEKAHWGKGLGRKMLEYAIDQAKERGYERMYLETHTALTEAMRLYEKLGFRFIEKPAGVLHTAMDRFAIKEL